jgi:8-hydroxy-5-deazaflavin:NADPH oxidoreductase
MKTTIIGAGNMGRGIGYRLVSGGHSVMIIDRNPESAEDLAKELRQAAKKGALVSTGLVDTADLGEVVVLAVGYGDNVELAKKLGTRLNGKVVVEISNTLNSTYDGLATQPNSSSAEEVARVVPAGVSVVKAFNTTFASTLVTGEIGGVPLDVFLAGNDEAAKQKVAQLVTDGGMVPVDTGVLTRAQQLEQLGFLGITLQMKHNFGFATGWKLIRNK